MENANKTLSHFRRAANGGLMEGVNRRSGTPLDTVFIVVLLNDQSANMMLERVRIVDRIYNWIKCSETRYTIRRVYP